MKSWEGKKIMKATDELKDKYKSPEGKELLVCDQCGLLFFGNLESGVKVPNSKVRVHKCYGCREGGLR